MDTQGVCSSLPLEKLLFRRQFILGPDFITGFPSWKRITLNNALYLTVHPDLPTYQAAYKNKSITLLGYVLDPHHPDADDPEIVNELIYKLDARDRFFEHANEFGGRWVLIVNDGTELRLFNDAAGLRQVFYTDVSYSTDLWCASQPGLIAEVLNLEVSQEASEFMNSPEYTHNKQHWWPGDSSPYKEIRHLLPNHYLNLDAGRAHRYWPSTNLDTLSPRESATKNSRILRGLAKSAHNRFDLALSLTAGWDSRVLLAATREMSDSLFYFTVTRWDPIESGTDVKIPARLLSKLGIRHNIIKCPDSMEGDFKKIYMRNVTTAHDAYGLVVQGLYDQYPQNRVCVKGDVSEIAKCYYRLPKSNGGKVTSQQLATLTKVGAHPFALNAFEKWLSGSTDSYNIDLLDLFCWEQVMGKLVAMIQAECDIVQEAFAPFNCRRLLTNMLSVHEKHRRPPKFKLYKELISNLWAEVLSEPINPREPRSIKALIKEVLIKTHLDQFVPKRIRRLGKRLLGENL